MEQKLYLGMNLFGGVIRWVAAPDQKIVVQSNLFHWIVASVDPHHDVLDCQVHGHISYIDQGAKRHTYPINKCIGSLV